MVDTGLGPRNGEVIVREMKKVSRNADVFVVTTHYHPEHSLGAGAFAGAKLVMTRMQQQDMTELGKSIQDTFASRSAINKELLSGVPYPTPDILFDREHRLDLGGEHVRLMWRGPEAMHTRGDTMVFVEEDRVLFTGDVVMSQRFLAAQNTSSLKTWLSVLDEFTALKPVHVVPSHGRLGDGTLIARDREFIQAVEQGRRTEDAKASRSMTPSPRWSRRSRRSIRSSETRSQRRRHGTCGLRRRPVINSRGWMLQSAQEGSRYFPSMSLMMPVNSETVVGSLWTRKWRMPFRSKV